MEGVRPRLAPAVPGVSSFLETNVRTYVHRGGAEPGVWFFSLDAASRLAVKLARALFHLPYFKATMSLERGGRERDGDTIDYRSSRADARSEGRAAMSARWTIGPPLGSAVAGTAEHFLAERYILYARDGAGSLWSGRVHHAPYPLHAATLERLEESLVAAAGLRPTSAPASVLYSPGVDVEVFALERVRG